MIPNFISQNSWDKAPPAGSFSFPSGDLATGMTNILNGAKSVRRVHCYVILKRKVANGFKDKKYFLIKLGSSVVVTKTWLLV